MSEEILEKYILCSDGPIQSYYLKDKKTGHKIYNPIAVMIYRANKSLLENIKEVKEN